MKLPLVFRGAWGKREKNPTQPALEQSIVAKELTEQEMQQVQGGGQRVRGTVKW